MLFFVIIESRGLSLILFFLFVESPFLSLYSLSSLSNISHFLVCPCNRISCWLFLFPFLKKSNHLFTYPPFHFILILESSPFTLPLFSLILIRNLLLFASLFSLALLKKSPVFCPFLSFSLTKESPVDFPFVHFYPYLNLLLYVPILVYHETKTSCWLSLYSYDFIDCSFGLLYNDIFSRHLEDCRSQRLLEDYSLTQTTLDEVFIRSSYMQKMYTCCASFFCMI